MARLASYKKQKYIGGRSLVLSACAHARAKFRKWAGRLASGSIIMRDITSALNALPDSGSVLAI